MTAPDPLSTYYATEYHRRNMQVARVCGAQAAVDQALERALTVKSIPVWLIAYLESAAKRLPGLQHDLAAWRDLASDAPETVRSTRAPLAAPAAIREAALHEALKRYPEAAPALAFFMAASGLSVAVPNTDATAWAKSIIAKGAAE